MPSRWDTFPKKLGTVKQRLLSRVHQEDRGYLTPCLIWDGETDGDGYGRIKYRGKYVQAHWVLIGKPPKGMNVDHLCSQRDCVRKSHLEFVTQQENTNRRKSVGNKERYSDKQKKVAKDMLRSGETVKRLR